MRHEGLETGCVESPGIHTGGMKAPLYGVDTRFDISRSLI